MCEYEYLCPICLEVITEAVWLVETRQLYDRGCLIKWLDHGGRNCPATGLPLPDAVRLRAAPQLQTRILAWAAEQGLDVPARPAPGCQPAADARRGRRKARWARARRSVCKFFARLLDESPKLYPGLADMNWAQHL